MKYFGLAALALMMTIGASAAQITTLCGSFSSPSDTAAGTWSCGQFNALTANGTVTSATLIYLSDYSNGTTASVTEVTNFTFTGGTLTNGADIITTVGGSSSSTYTSAQGATFDTFGIVSPTSLAGFLDPITSLGGATNIQVQYSNGLTAGGALATTGYAELVINYTPNAVPEPGSMMLLGSGLVGFALLGRKLVRK